MIETCHKDGKLVYVKFIARDRYDAVAASNQLGAPVGSWEWRGDHAFPKRGQLFENVDGKYKDSNRRVTAEELDAFFASGPEAFTIDLLLTFVDKSRANLPKN